MNIIVALHCEAENLICELGLKRNASHHNYPIFSNERFHLIISGVGRVASAAALAYLAGLKQERNQIWLNFGIAGSSHHEIGQMLIADKIMDINNGKNWYPYTTLPHSFESSILYSADHIETAYENPGLFDMESAGFFATACKFSSIELIHCLKIVSDNPQHKNIFPEKSFVRELTSDATKRSITFIDSLQALEQSLIKNPEPQNLFLKLCNKIHFTTYQQHQLRDLLNRLETLHDYKAFDTTKIESLNNASSVLKTLESEIEKFTVDYS